MHPMHANFTGSWCVSSLRHRQAHCGAAPCCCVRQTFLTLAAFFLQEGKRGAGEMWVFSPTTDAGVFTIQCCGGEQGLYLEHGQGQLYMTCKRGEANQKWVTTRMLQVAKNADMIRC